MLLQHALHFHCERQYVWPELLQDPVAPVNFERSPDYSKGIRNNWVVRTYHELGRIGVHATISGSFRSDAINIASVHHLGRRRRPANAFIVIPRGDAHPPMLANFCIEQNFLSSPTERRAGLPHWPQPGILPRSPERGARIERLSFKGRTFNLDERFRSQEFVDALSGIGVSLDLDEFDGQSGGESWSDYRTTDAVLAVRNLTRKDAVTKPASKLVNCWLAGVVPILGPEPAFQELRRSKLDYLEVVTPSDVVDHLRVLKENPQLYLDIVQNGRRRSTDFTEEAIARKWIDLLNGPIARAFEEWKAKSTVGKLLELGAMCLREPISKRNHFRNINSGGRILDR